MDLSEGLDLMATLAGYDRGLTPLRLAEPNGRSLADPETPGGLTTGLGDDLAMLVTKVCPTMSEAQADAWIKVMCAAMSDLPGRIAREAVRAALHRPMQFISEVETVVRSIAAETMARHRMARARICDLARERARRAQAANDPLDPITDDEIARMSPEMRRLGIGCGALTAEQVERAISGVAADDNEERLVRTKRAA